jgi:hypothetical protein
VHGAEKAFKLSVDKICEWYGLKPRSEPRLAMLASSALYLNKELMSVEQEQSADRQKSERMKLVEKASDEHISTVAEQAYQKAKDEIASIRGGFLKSIKRFTA